MSPSVIDLDSPRTEERPGSGKEPKGRIALTAIAAALGGLLFGFDTAIISGTIPYIKRYFALDDYRLGWAVSSILIGCVLGALLAGKLADRYGRRTCLRACALVFAVSGIGVALSNQLWIFVGFRLLGGLAVGAAALVAPMYIAEIVPPKWRGRLVSCYQMAIVSGILLAYFSNYSLNSLGEDNWRWMFASQVLPSVLFFFALLPVPETPRWLLGKGRRKEAYLVFKNYTGIRLTEAQLIAIEGSFHHQKRVPFNLMFSKAFRRVMFLGIVIAVFQQVTGINSILYYAPVIFKQTGVSSDSSLLQTIGIGAVNVISTLIAILFVDRLGRRKFFLTGAALMGISLAVVAACFHYHYFQNCLVLIFMLLYVASFGCTLGAVTWVYLSEIFPNQIRSLALSLATLSLWLADFAVTYTFPVMTAKLGTSATLLAYALLCAFAFVYMYGKVKETRGRSLEEIETLFIN